jgi:hypothetical protein
MTSELIFDHQRYQRFCWAADKSEPELEAHAAQALSQLRSAVLAGNEKAAVDAAMSLYEIARELEYRRALSPRRRAE